MFVKLIIVLSLSSRIIHTRVLSDETTIQTLLAETRIVHGFRALPGQFPHQVCLLNRRTSNQYSLCGGSIISNSAVLTAAHCVIGVVSTSISFGTTDRNFPFLTLTATERIVHEKYDSKSLNNDIALWKLPTKISFNEHVRSIPLPKQSQASNSFENYPAIVSGYGRTEDSTSSSRYLRYAPVRVVGNLECVRIYGSHVVRNSTICTLGYQIVEQGPCNGDSGSPLTWKDDGRDVLIGVASFVSSKGCGSDRPSGFVRTSEFLEWLSDNAGIDIMM